MKKQRLDKSVKLAVNRVLAQNQIVIDDKFLDEEYEIFSYQIIYHLLNYIQNKYFLDLELDFDSEEYIKLSDLIYNMAKNLLESNVLNCNDYNPKFEKFIIDNVMDYNVTSTTLFCTLVSVLGKKSKMLYKYNFLQKEESDYINETIFNFCKNVTNKSKELILLIEKFFDTEIKIDMYKKIKNFYSIN